ncbi:Nif3-like dinuclear metal center hexameric protein [Buchnera aphidicola (Formosaphis micheliae)]|uniref:Nif3-like dinuclear metal center hexameric protein n=1 Tax=Buchnera aphidicola TaxID=9 RepID=UPI0031B801ED
MNNFDLENIINIKLNSHQFDDFSPNGLQIEGAKNIKKIVSGVSICQELLNKAIELKASAIIVHHGCFWNKTKQVITGIQKKRLKTLMLHNINLYSWHLPLDAHPEIGNNAQIAKKLNITIQGHLLPYVPWGTLKNNLSGKELSDEIIKHYNRVPFHERSEKNCNISKLAWCSGKGQGFMKDINLSKLDAFLTGEISEETIYMARENNLHFYAIGHYASERDGIIALGDWLTKKYNLNITFVDINNPI